MAISLFAATTALAATYTGRGADDPKVRVSFEKDGQTIKRFKIERARFFCTDGDRFRAATRVGRMRVRRTASGERRFSGAFTNNEGDQHSFIRGRLLEGGRARGSYRLSATFDEVGCTTRSRAWRARKR